MIQAIVWLYRLPCPPVKMPIYQEIRTLTEPSINFTLPWDFTFGSFSGRRKWHTYLPTHRHIGARFCASGNATSDRSRFLCCYLAGYYAHWIHQ